MTRLRFAWAKLMRQEVILAQLSVLIDELAQEVRDRSIALVGNARSMVGASHGAQIDASDIVVRINSAPIPSELSHGSRTDWHALAIRKSHSIASRINPQRSLWMSHKRKRLDWATASSRGFYLFPLADFSRLAQELGAPPTTGLMLIDLLERLPVGHVKLFGFDFFASRSLSGSRTAEQVPHDFDEELQWVQRLLARDERFTLIATCASPVPENRNTVLTPFGGASVNQVQVAEGMV